MSQPIITEDNVQVNVGDRIFDYYDMLEGIIDEVPDPQGWFDVKHPDGSRHLLNGQRICSIQFAVKKGWIQE